MLYFATLSHEAQKVLAGWDTTPELKRVLKNLWFTLLLTAYLGSLSTVGCGPWSKATRSQFQV